MAINFSSSNPAAPTGKENIAWQGDAAATPPAMSGNIPNIAGVNAQTGTSYTVQESDNGKLVTFSNGSAVAVTIPAAGTLSAKFHCAFTNLGAGTVTLTLTTSTIDGASSLALTTNQGVELFSDATNYSTLRGMGSGGGTVPTTRNISTTAPLTGGGDLSADRTLAVSTMVGDSGAGGSRGVVPAPAAGDAAAGKFLKADGTFAVPPGTGGSGTVTHTGGALTAHAVVVGNGADDEKVLAALGSAGQYLRSGGASADPAMASIAESEVTNLVSDLALKAPLASPALTGAPTVPTPINSDNSTTAVNSAWVKNQSYATTTGGGSGTANITPDTHPTSPNLEDDEFEVGSSIDTAGTRKTSAVPWSWINQGSATAVVGSGYLTLTAPSSASHNFRIVQQPVSGSAWRFRAKIRTFFTPDGTSVAEVGMIVSASGGKFITFLTLIPGNIANVQMFLARWTNPTTQAAGTTSGTIISCAIQEALPWIYLDIELAAATLTLKYSWDGVTFKTFTTETLAAHIITADNIGLMANVEGGTSVTTNVCDWFRRIS